MKKEINIVNHDAVALRIMDARNKIIVGVLSCILPIIAFFEGYNLFSSSGYFWLSFIIVIVSIASNLYYWNSKTFSLTIVIQFLLAGGIIGTHVFTSLAKGIELLTGPQDGTFFSFPAQQGLINLEDATVIVIVLIFSVITLSYFVFKRREVEVFHFLEIKKRKLNSK